MKKLHVLILLLLLLVKINVFAQTQKVTYADYKNLSIEKKIEFCKINSVEVLNNFWPQIKLDLLNTKEKVAKEKGDEIFNLIIFVEGKINYVE